MRYGPRNDSELGLLQDLEGLLVHVYSDVLLTKILSLNYLLNRVHLEAISEDGIGLPGASLPVGEDGRVESIQHAI